MSAEPKRTVLARDAMDIRRRTLHGEPVAHLADEYQISQRAVRNIRDGRTWRNLPTLVPEPGTAEPVRPAPEPRRYRRFITDLSTEWTWQQDPSGL